ncbi:MAG: DUF359 domain-containing protein [Candidatus Undinarchaeales archaeon]
MIKDFKIPEEASKFLKKPQGDFISESELSDLDEVVSVGDEVTLTLLEKGINPKLAVVDYKIQREEIEPKQADKIKSFGKKVEAENPAGSISLDAWNKIKENKDKEGIRLEVKGEEDLLALACFFIFPEGTNIIYGQPEEGIILFKVSEKKKQEYAEMLISTSAGEFLNSINGKTVILHHSDSDGLCSAALFIKYLETKGIETDSIISADPVIHENLFNEIENENPENLILLDLGGEAGKSIRKLSKDMNILILDHHQIFETDFGPAQFLNPHLFELPENRIAPTSYLAYKTVEMFDWLASIGVIADRGEVSCPDFLEKVRKKYDVDLDELVDLIESADAAKKSKEALQILLASNEPEDLLENEKLIQYEDLVSLEIEQLIKKHKEDGEWLSDSVFLYEISSDFEIRGDISNLLQEKYSDKVIIIGEQEGDSFNMSLRTERDDVDFPKAIKKSIKGMKEATGGGHAKASGVKVLVKEKENFLENFIKSLNIS